MARREEVEKGRKCEEGISNGETLLHLILGVLRAASGRMLLLDVRAATRARPSSRNEPRNVPAEAGMIVDDDTGVGNV